MRLVGHIPSHTLVLKSVVVNEKYSRFIVLTATEESPHAATEPECSPLSCPMKLDDSLLESGTAHSSSVWSVNSSDSSSSSCTSSRFVDRFVMRGRSCDVWQGQRFLSKEISKPNTTSTKIAINNATTKEGSVGLFGPDLLLFFPKKKIMKRNDVLNKLVSSSIHVSQSVSQPTNQSINRTINQTNINQASDRSNT